MSKFKLRKFLELREDLTVHRKFGLAIGLVGALLAAYVFAWFEPAFASTVQLRGQTLMVSGLAGALLAYLAGWAVEFYQAAFTEDRTPDPVDAYVTAAGGLDGAMVGMVVVFLITQGLAG